MDNGSACHFCKNRTRRALDGWMSRVQSSLRASKYLCIKNRLATNTRVKNLISYLYSLLTKNNKHNYTISTLEGENLPKGTIGTIIKRPPHKDMEGFESKRGMMLVHYLTDLLISSSHMVNGFGFEVCT